MKTATRLARLCGLAGLLLVLVAFVFLAVGPRTGRYRTMTVLTASMRPTHPAGSVIVSVPVPSSSVRVGDVITYRIPVEDRRIVTHRVVEVVEPGVVRTKGDANNTPDAWTARLTGATVWKVRGGVPALGFALGALQNRAARAGSLMLAPLALAFVWLRDIWRRPDASPLPAATASPLATPARLALDRSALVMAVWVLGSGLLALESRNRRSGSTRPRHA